MDDQVIARGEELSVLGMEIRVMALEDVMVTKLMAITEHSLRYEGLLQIARRCASRSTGTASGARTEKSPFARAFFVLLEGLDIPEPAEAPSTDARTRRHTPRHWRVGDLDGHHDHP